MKQLNFFGRIRWVKLGLLLGMVLMVVLSGLGCGYYDQSDFEADVGSGDLTLIELEKIFSFEDGGNFFGSSVKGGPAVLFAYEHPDGFIVIACLPVEKIQIVYQDGLNNPYVRLIPMKLDDNVFYRYDETIRDDTSIGKRIIMFTKVCFVYIDPDDMSSFLRYTEIGTGE